jgi:GNAT superfamily N-acetyltransferase
MIITVSFEFIKDIWQQHLWPDRKSSIDSHSAMLLSKEFELKNFEYPASFFVYIHDDTVAGCNSGHKCCDNTYRSRGLYVFPKFRKQGIGKELLLATVRQGKKEDCDLVWSYPRFESWTTYKSAGFELISDWSETETGLNAYCSQSLK